MNEAKRCACSGESMSIDHGVDGRENAVVPQRLERRERRMQPEESIEVDRRVCRAGRGARDGDRGTHSIVVALAERHDDVQRVRRAALEEHDQHLAPCIAVQRGPPEQVLSEHRPSQEARGEPHRGQGHRAGFHEYSAVHSDSGYGMLSDRGATRAPSV